VIELPPKRGMGAQLKRALRAAATGTLVPASSISSGRAAIRSRGGGDHSAVFDAAAREGLDGKTAERPQHAEVVFEVSHRDARPEPGIETAGLEVRCVLKPNSRARRRR
jgi:hypothetical protein